MFDVEKNIRQAQRKDLSQVIIFRNAIFQSENPALKSFAVDLTKNIHAGKILSMSDVIAESASYPELFDELASISNII